MRWKKRNMKISRRRSIGESDEEDESQEGENYADSEENGGQENA
jgi:hypothetical protein